jgi:hypothetical protein
MTTDTKQVIYGCGSFFRGKGCKIAGKAKEAA